MGKQQTDSRTNPQSITLQDAQDAFLLDRQAQRMTPRTVEFYTEKLQHFTTYCAARNVTHLDDVTPTVIRSYLVHEQARNLKPHTIHGSARALRAFLNFCAADGMVDAAPKFAMPKLPKERLPAFDGADVARLLDACDSQRDRLVVLVLLDTGLRASEFVNLDGGDIDERTGAVQVRQGKGQKDRTVYIGARTRRELARYWRTERRPGLTAPVWVNLNTGARLKSNGLRQLLRRIGDRAGVSRVHPHRFRRTFAIECLRAGMDVYALAALMGHSDIGVLRPYLALVRQDLRNAHAKHSPVDRMSK